MPEIEIKDNPTLRTFLRNMTEYTFTGVVWGVWVYLLLPIVNIILWVLGIKFFKVSVISQVGYMELLDLLDKMGWTVLIIFLILRSWGYYNYVKFGRRNRRKGAPHVTAEQMADYFKIPADEVRHLQTKKEVVWDHIK